MRVSRRGFTASLWAALTVPANGQTRGQDPSSLIWGAGDIAWEADDPPGSKYAVLDGNRSDPTGLFTYAFWLPGGVWAPPHYHSQDAHVAVMRGALRLGFDRRADRRQTRLVSAGQFFIVRANQVHFEGSDAECLIVGTARGGWTTTVVG